MTFVELFAGIGGFRYGLEAVGQFQQMLQRPRRGGNIEINGGKPQFNCVWANELDRYACQIYRRHYGGIYEGDIRAVDASTIPDHDLLCAGFPCQSFSIAGKRKGFQDTRGTLFFEICRVLRAKRPRYVFLENVKGLLSSDNGETFLAILRQLDDLGYDCQWQVLNSKDFGVPQNRERVFLIGHTRGQPRPKVFPIGEADTAYQESDGEGRVVTSAITTENAHQFGKNVTAKQAIDIATCLDSNYGKGWLDHGQRTMIYDVYSQGRNIRRLTPTECERLQGFPDGWTEGISDTQRYKCLGNAVTTNVITAIGRQFLEGI